MLFERREKCGVRTPVPHRYTEPLGIAVDDVRAHFAGRRQEREAEEIGANGDSHAGGARARDQRAVVVHDAGFVRRLEQDPEQPIAKFDRGRIADDELDPERLGASQKDGERLRKTRVGGKKLCRSDD